MARLNTKKFAFFFKSGATLPIAPANFLELDEKLLLISKPKIEKYKRYNGKLGANDSYADVCDVSQEGINLSQKMRFQNSAANALDTIPDYGEVLKVGGFTETVDSTPSAETVTYTWNKDNSPILGSAVYYLDGKKKTMTNTIALNVAFNFEIGKAAMLTASMNTFYDNNGVAVNEANPTVTLNDEACLMVGCLDIYTEDGVGIVVDKISLDMGAQINKFYGLNLKEYETSDFEPTIDVDFALDATDYNDAITKLTAETKVNLVIKLGTNAGVEVNGKTVVFTITNVKLSDYSDADNNDTIKRTHNFILTADTVFTIKTGFFA